MICPMCGKTMKNIMHFEKDKNYAFHECPGCYVRTHKKRIHFEDVKEEKKNDIRDITKRNGHGHEK